MLMSEAACRVMVSGNSRVCNAGSRLIGDGPSVPRAGIPRCNKCGNPPCHLGFNQQGRVTLIRHHDDFKLAAPFQSSATFSIISLEMASLMCSATVPTPDQETSKA